MLVVDRHTSAQSSGGRGYASGLLICGGKEIKSIYSQYTVRMYVA